MGCVKRRRYSLIFAGLLALMLAATARAADPALIQNRLVCPFGSELLPHGKGLALCITHDAEFNLWVGTEQSGVWRWRDGQWQTFTAKDGLGDSSAYAIACDHQDRIWVGHRDHGVSVFANGSWKNYSIETGPSGLHVSAIAVCPTNGDVWMNGERGLSRYSPQTNLWSYYSRATGMPTDQINSIAFDASGNIVLGTDCLGIALADAADGYRHWRLIPGSTSIPRHSSGSGIPSNLINQVVVGPDGTIYAATTRGLARSHDRGVTWTFLRGADWPDLVRGSYEGAPPDWKPDAPGFLREDWVQSLAFDDAGLLWLGFRSKGLQAIDPATNAVADSVPDDSFAVLAIDALPGTISVASYTPVITRLTAQDGTATPEPAAASTQPDFPAPAAAPSVKDFLALQPQVESLPKAPGVWADCLEDDWATHGDWYGHYGRQFAAPTNISGNALGDFTLYSIQYLVGPFAPGQLVYYHTWRPGNYDAADAPWDWLTAKRVMSACNDSSWQTLPDNDQKLKFPLSVEGPDLYLGVKVPPGTHTLSVYILSPDGANGVNVFRDFLFEIKAPLLPGPAVTDDAQHDFVQRDLIDVEMSPTLAISRANRLAKGVYKRFIVHGGGMWWIKINRNHSKCTQIEGVFVDRLGEGNFDRAHIHYGELANFDPPKAPDDAGPMEARDLWNALDASVDHKNYAAWSAYGRFMAYRVALAAQGDPKLLADWRWHLRLWSDDDRAAFANFISKAKSFFPDQ